MPKGPIRRLIVSVVMVAAALLPAQAEDASRVEHWRSDLSYLDQVIRTRHPMAFARVSENAYAAQVRKLHDAIPNLSDTQISLEMMRIAGTLRDGHTLLDPTASEPFATGWYPVRFYWFADGLYITSIATNLAEAVGKRVTHIGGSPAAEVAADAAALMGADNRFGDLNNTFFLSSARVMEALGHASPSQPLNVRIAKGEETAEIEIPAVEGPGDIEWRFYGEFFAPFWNSDVIELTTAFGQLSPVELYRGTHEQLPLHLRHRRPYGITYLESADAVHFAFNNVVRSHREVRFEQVLDELFATLDAHPDASLIIDLRYNSGGDGSIVRGLVHRILQREKLNRYGRLYAITGRKTFSAALNFLGILAANTEVIVVGEPPSAEVNMFGDALPYVLPHSGMTLHLSQSYFQFTESSENPGRDTLFRIDVPVLMRADDYFSGRDPVLERILSGNDLRPLAALAFELSPSQLRSIYQSRIAAYGQHEWWRASDRNRLHIAGLDLLAAERVDEALAALKINAEVHPGWWRAWDDLAQAHRRAGNEERAMVYFRHSLELEPGNDHARQAIEELADAKEGATD
ncbi:MAG: hypothetical protein ACR2JJ_04025 [Sphingomicrobium sp.]